MPSTNATEFRHVRTGSLNIPPQSGAMSPVNGQQQRFDGPRSPPNTSHVPCKFFRQGACQAGSACPFSHDLSAATENVCKYFAKGNCKFGPKCANVHVLPDGRRINYGKNGVTIGQPMNLGGRINPSFHPAQSALTNSFMRADAAPFGGFGYPGDERVHQLGRQPSLENGLPTIDTTYSSHQGSQYGSPREEDPTRLGLGLSPSATKGLSVLDAPLPASFDSNGISNAARYPAGPWPSSVPSQFGLDSPSPSLTTAKESRTSEALKMLHHSAFGSNDRLSSTLTASSPPTAPNDEYFGKRPMHSSRFAKSKLLSSSAPRPIAGGIDRDWEAEFPFLEEDYVPDNLKDLLTPAEKARRGSHAAEDDVNSAALSSGLSGNGTPTARTSSKFGSPATASPSRWGPLFQRQEDDKRRDAASAGAFGHVGSPLRNSSLHADAIRHHNGSRSTSGNIGDLSSLTQQMHQTRIDGDGSPMLHPNVSRPTNGRASERHVSSGSISSSARYTTPIGEEDGEFVFSMDEDGDSTLRAKKRSSGAGTVMGVWGLGGASYAGAATGKPKEESRIVDGVGGR